MISGPNEALSTAGIGGFGGIAGGLQSARSKAMAPVPQPAPAEAPATTSGGAEELTKQGLLVCADVLRGQGFVVTEKEIDRPLYEFDVIKDNQEWKVKMSGDCEIVLQKLD